MKFTLVIICTLFSMHGFAKKHNCSVKKGAYNEAFKAIVDTNEEYPYVYVGDSYMTPCETSKFDKELSDYILNTKLNMLGEYMSEENSRYVQLKKLWTKNHKKALNGMLVLCQPDPMSKMGMIVKGKSSFFIMEGGNAYFEMSAATCSK